MYDPLTESWINDTSMPTARGYAGVAVLNDEFYLIGGIFAPYEGYIVMTNSATTNEQLTPIVYGTPEQFPSLTPTPSPTPSATTPTPEPPLSIDPNFSFYTGLALLIIFVAMFAVFLFYFKKRKH